MPCPPVAAPATAEILGADSVHTADAGRSATGVDVRVVGPDHGTPWLGWLVIRYPRRREDETAECGQSLVDAGSAMHAHVGQRRRNALWASMATMMLEATRMMRSQASISMGSTRRMSCVTGR